MFFFFVFVHSLHLTLGALKGSHILVDVISKKLFVKYKKKNQFWLTATWLQCLQWRSAHIMEPLTIPRLSDDTRLKEPEGVIVVVIVSLLNGHQYGKLCKPLVKAFACLFSVRSWRNCLSTYVHINAWVPVFLPAGRMDLFSTSTTSVHWPTHNAAL